jgi:hypothetical protein
MADQNRNQQSNENQSRGQQGQQGQQGTENEPRQTQPDRENQPGQQGRGREEDESMGVGGSQRDRTTREPASTAHDRGVGGEPRSTKDRGTGNLEDVDEGIESDLDVETDIEEEDTDIEGGGGRSNR